MGHDIDSDGDPDLYVTVYGRNRLYLNQGDGTFEEIGASVGVDHPGWSSSAAFFDLDGDGDLDLYLVNYLDFDLADPPNRGDPCLQEGVPISCSPAVSPALADALYRNDGIRFTDISRSAGVDIHDGAYGLGVLPLRPRPVHRLHEEEMGPEVSGDVRMGPDHRLHIGGLPRLEPVQEALPDLLDSIL